MDARRSLREPRTLAVCVIVAALALAVAVPSPMAWPVESAWQAVLLGARSLAFVMLPGGLAVLCARGDDWSALDAACLAPILSLAIWPIVLLWMTLAGLAMCPPVIRAIIAASGAGIIAFRLARRPSKTTISHRWGAALLAAVAVIALGMRYWAIRDMVFPSWSDSYHHTIIAEVIRATGHVPSSYEPFARIPTYSYHFGYHAMMAAFGEATGLPSHQALLVGGQLLIALSVPSLYVAVARMTGKPRAGLVAAAIVGLAFRMPSFYVNWGRYPQLAGHLLMPVAVALALEAVRGETSRWRFAVLAGLLVGALGLTHYRIAIFFLAAVPWAVGASLRQAWPIQRERWRVLARWAAVGALAVAITIPWLPMLLAKTTDTAQRVATTYTGQQVDQMTLAFVEGYGLMRLELIVAGLGALWALVRLRRSPFGALVCGWLATVVWLANPNVSGIPNGFLPNGAVIVAMYLPAAALIGWAADDIAGLAAGRLASRGENRHMWTNATLAALVALACLAGSCHALAKGIDPWYQLVHAEDVEVMAWIRNNTPEDALFCVDATGWLDDAAVASDAGLWLPYAARRACILPPMIYITELPADEVDLVHSRFQAIQTAATPQALAEAMRLAGATHVYIGQRADPTWAALTADETAFEPLYEVGCARVLAIR